MPHESHPRRKRRGPSLAPGRVDRRIVALHGLRVRDSRKMAQPAGRRMPPALLLLRGFSGSEDGLSVRSSPLRAGGRGLVREQDHFLLAGKIQFGARRMCDHRSGSRDVGRHRIVLSGGAKIPGPEKPAHVENARHPGTQIRTIVATGVRPERGLSRVKGMEIAKERPGPMA